MTKQQLKELSAQLDLATKQLDTAATKLLEAGCVIEIKVSRKVEINITPADIVESITTITTTERI